MDKSIVFHGLRNIMQKKLLSPLCYVLFEQLLAQEILHQFCTSDSEAINSSIKQFLHFKKLDWPTFNDMMKRFVMEQQEEVCKAVIGTGQYSLKKKYQSLSIAPSNWFTVLNDEQRENAKRKFQEACVMSSQILVNDHVSQGEKRKFL